MPPVETADDDVCRALRGLAAGDRYPWAERTAVRVRGDARLAVAALGYRHAAFAQCSLADALVNMARTGASGGLRTAEDPGAARGRERAWGVLKALADGDELEATGKRVRWWLVDPHREPWEWLWEFHFALHDPRQERAWALRACDTD